MRHLLCLIALVLCLLPETAAAQRRRAPATINVRLGTQVDWSYQRHRAPVRYRFGDITLTVRGVRQSGDSVRPQIIVQAPGRAPVEMNGSATFPSMEHRIGVGQLDPGGTRFVYLQSFTGGAHCCNAIRVGLVEPGRIRLVSLGDFDGEGGDFPRDEDGDGVVDFVQSDNSFLYAFTFYAASLSPPQIFNIVDGRVVDVSGRPGFRRLFQQAMDFARPLCLTPESGGEPNGACAAYVAAAARLGQFDDAWARMLRAYNRSGDWELPTGCRIEIGDGECPQGSIIRFPNYPEALRYFLARRGYIAK